MIESLWSRFLGVALALAVAAPAAAQISAELRPAAPGSDELVLGWAADPSLAGPFHLLRTFVEPGERVEGVLPLDPVLDRWAALVTSPLSLSRSVDGPDRPGTVVFQVVSEDGGCSNLSYAFRLEPPAAGPQGRWRPSQWVALPWRGGTRLLSELIDDQPQVVGAATWLGSRPEPLHALRREGADGFRGADSFVPQGAGVYLLIDAREPVTLVGAAESSKTGIPAGGRGTGPVSALSVPLGTPLRVATELLCGREGVDYTIDPATGRPSECTAGWFDSLSGVNATVQRLRPEAGFQGRNAFAVGGSFFLIGPDFELDPRLAAVENQGVGARPPTTWLPEDLGVPAACTCPDSDGDGNDDCTEALLGTDPGDPSSRGPDHDRDGVPDDLDRCPGVADPGQEDLDGDGLGDACDPCPAGDPACEDPDGDGRLAPHDNCPETPNPDQADRDFDFLGDACDPCPEITDLVLPVPDADGDGVGDACDCAPNAAGSWAEPGPRADLRVIHGVLAPGIDPAGLIWDDTRPALGSGTTWSVARGALAALRSEGPAASAQCLDPAAPEPEWIDFDPGSWWYLVRAVNDCGAASWGTPRRPSPLDADSPCP